MINITLQKSTTFRNIIFGIVRLFWIRTKFRACKHNVFNSFGSNSSEKLYALTKKFRKHY